MGATSHVLYLQMPNPPSLIQGLVAVNSHHATNVVASDFLQEADCQRTLIMGTLDIQTKKQYFSGKLLK